MTKIIKINNLNYSIFNNFSISFNKDELTTISGSNRSGKTLLLKIISGKVFLKGDIEINNKNINDYSNQEIYNLVGYISKEELSFNYDNVLNELKYITSKTTEVIKKYSLEKIKNKDIKDLKLSEKIYLSLIINILRGKEILLIDNVDNYLREDEMLDLITVIKDYHKTIIMTINNLNYSLESNQLYILKSGSIILKGEPKEVLKHDTTINKIGLDLPFMYDLSIKLKDYNLLGDIELNMDRMLDKLWK